MQQKQQQDANAMTMSDAFNIMYFLSNVHATCISPFIRFGFGAEHPGMVGLFAMLFIFLVACCDSSGMTFVYLVAWLCALAYRRIQTRGLLRQGAMIHSRNPGYPWLALKFPFVRTELSATAVIEPLLCLVAAFLLIPLSVPLGLLVMGGFISFTVRNGIEHEVTRKRLQAMQDARMEQEYYSRRFRSQSGR